MPIIYTNKKLPKRAEADLYVTPQPVVDMAMRHFRDYVLTARVILDIGANDGRWGLGATRAADKPLCLTGVDIRRLAQPEGFTFWHQMDYSRPLECELMSVKSYDLIVSNPPFNVAEAIVWNAWRQLKNGGSMIFLLPGSFWYSQGRFCGLWREIPPVERASVVKRISFTGDSNPNLNDLYLWQKDEQGRAVGVPNETRNTQVTF